MKLRLSQKTFLLVIVPLLFDLCVVGVLTWLVWGVAQHSLQLSSIDVIRLATAMLLSAVVLSAGFAIFFVVYFNRTISSRLKLLVENTIDLSKGASPAQPLAGTDEIAKLDQSFRSMAASLREASEKERAVVTYASDVICSFDLAGKCLSMNAASKRLWGYDPEELIGKDIFSVIAASDKQRLLGHVHSVHVKTGPGEYELRVCRKDGTFADTLWSLYWSVENSWIVGVVHDITARKATERLQAEFTAMVSHDLRSPLSTIQMFLQGLDAGLWGTMPDAARANCAKARELITRLVGLTDDLLSYEKMEAGEFALNLEELDLAQVVEESIHSVSGIAQQNGVQILAQPCDFRLVGDRTRLVQVLTNVLSNAVKYSPPGDVVTISVSQDPTFLVVQVADKGPGISDKNKGLIFEKFKQADSPDVKKGTGLGLAICKRFVEYHGGRIGVVDGANRGSVFWFKLPRNPTLGAPGAS
jgi:PAS domain S-box-containing protein